MKIIFLVFVVLASLQIQAQTALTPSTLALTPPTRLSGTVNPALAGVAGSRDLALSTPATPGTNLLTDLAQLLVTLESQLQQTLPALAAFNNNFDFLDTGGVLSTNLTADAATGGTGNASVNLGQDFSTMLGVNLGQNLSTSVAVPANPLPSASSSPPSTIVTSAVGGTGFVAFPIVRDTVRALMILQADTERMLQLLNAVNNGTNLGNVN